MTTPQPPSPLPNGGTITDGGLKPSPEQLAIDFVNRCVEATTACQYGARITELTAIIRERDEFKNFYTNIRAQFDKVLAERDAITAAKEGK